MDENTLNNSIEYWHTHETNTSLQNFLNLSNEDMEFWHNHSDEEFIKYLENKANK